MNKKLPKKIKVGSRNFDVIFPAKFIAAPEHQGMFKEYAGKIEVVDSGNNKINWKIFMHEVVHAIDTVFCGRVFNEFEIELLSNAIISLVLDNDNLFSRKDFPESIRVFGWHYDIVENYEFLEARDTASFMDFDHGIIYFSNSAINNISPEFNKIQLITGAVRIISSHIFSHEYNLEFVEEFPVSQFVNGLLEVFIDNDLERSLKEVYLK